MESQDRRAVYDFCGWQVCMIGGGGKKKGAQRGVEGDRGM